MKIDLDRTLRRYIYPDDMHAPQKYKPRYTYRMPTGFGPGMGSDFMVFHTLNSISFGL